MIMRALREAHRNAPAPHIVDILYLYLPYKPNGVVEVKRAPLVESMSFVT